MRKSLTASIAALVIFGTVLWLAPPRRRPLARVLGPTGPSRAPTSWVIGTQLVKKNQTAAGL